MTAPTRIIALGNRAACKYRNHPAPPPGLPLDKLEIWARDVCGLDVSDVPAVGDPVRDSQGNLQYTVEASHRAALLTELIERPVLAAVLTGVKLCTKIRVSPASTLLQAVAECRTVWSGGTRGALAHAGPDAKPAWIAGTDAALVTVLASELGITEIREYEADETDEG